MELGNRERLRLLHVRGGVSTVMCKFIAEWSSSPRPWRCFYKGLKGAIFALVFSTSVEVFPNRVGYGAPPLRLLHVRGGVSKPVHSAMRRARSSPRPWRCFLKMMMLEIFYVVFSTSVEMFPTTEAKNKCLTSLLYVRGGVSVALAIEAISAGSSPCPWRCFWIQVSPFGFVGVFSTSVEVFPKRSTRRELM